MEFFSVINVGSLNEITKVGEPNKLTQHYIFAEFQLKYPQPNKTHTTNNLH